MYKIYLLSMGWIYRFISPSGKSYIGQTTRNPTERYKDHFKASTNCKLLKRAIDKYGEDMQFEIIEEVSNEILDEREIFWIGELNTLAPHGYNCTGGGNSKKQLSQTLKASIGEGVRNAKINKDGYIGSVKKQRNGFRPQTILNGEIVYLSNGTFNTKEEAINVLQIYTKDPKNFKKIEGYNRRVIKGGVHRNGNKWRITLKNKWIGSFDTEAEARTYLQSLIET